MEFKKISDLEKHEKLIHERIRTFQFSMHILLSDFPKHGATLINRYMSSRHETEKPFKCEKCDSLFTKFVPNTFLPTLKTNKCLL